MPSTNQKVSILATMTKFIESAQTRLSKGTDSRGDLRFWSDSVRTTFVKIYGTEHESAKLFLPRNIPNDTDTREEFENRIQLLENYVVALEHAGISVFSTKNPSSRVFIGHGQSPIWRELKDFLNDRLDLQWDEFNREAVAGITTFNRISTMLESASFAFLIMTGEDQHSDASTHARQNVVHEIGLFQGKLGSRKAIVLLEEGCTEFSNIAGLSQIRFPKRKISAIFEEIRRVLEREKVI